MTDPRFRLPGGPRSEASDGDVTTEFTDEQLSQVRRRGQRQQQVGLATGDDHVPLTRRALRGDDASDPDREHGDADSNGSRSGRKRSAVREFAVVIGIALILSMLVKTFLLQPFWIPSGSMENTLVRGDRVVVSKLTPGVFDLKRGDVVVFADDEHWLDAPNVQRSMVADAIIKPLQFVGLYPEGDDHLIKRLIGLPGDHVTCTPGGKLTVNGDALNEPYLYPGDQPCQDAFDIVVPAGKAWVMGDHRSASGDSREHDDGSGGRLGSISISSITGRAVAIVWPLDRMGGLSNYSSTFDKVPNP